MEEQTAAPTDQLAKLAPSRKMRAKFLREVSEARLPSGPGPRDPVTALELDALPAAAARYLRFMGVEGQPRVWSFRACWQGQFRMGPDKPWMACEAWQYNTSLSIARLFHMRVRFGGVVPLYVRDTYAHGQGRMLGRVVDAFTVVDEADFRIDTGELVTYLNDALFFAPSMLLVAQAKWTAVDDSSFDVALTDGKRTVTGRAFLDERGALRDFSTTDRYGTDPTSPKMMVRARWSTPVDGWQLKAGRMLPTGGRAVWHFPTNAFAYASFDFTGGTIEFDVAPGAP